MGCSVQPEPVRVVKTQDTSRGWPPEISGRKKRHFAFGKYLPLRTKNVPYGGNPRAPAEFLNIGKTRCIEKVMKDPAALAHGAAATRGTRFGVDSGTIIPERGNSPSDTTTFQAVNLKVVSCSVLALRD